MHYCGRLANGCPIFVSTANRTTRYQSVIDWPWHRARRHGTKSPGRFMEIKHPSSYEILCARELAWYRKHGKYPDNRISQDDYGVEYVIGDFSWNRENPPEFIEKRMSYYEQG